ncbi:hypothetical protein CLAFUW4_06828 [Fulvia fulva]|uniref:DUF2423 domain-containing protein n=1 Tax=Passalora fulva TaxID=5499 RepID=A0A9Q8LJR7_PASFU|nr:uncharacterized protein CLAFUR5_06964 [Fulvia fulva]KAK4621719.1 hypothetical protein CLAFUR4_06836 [Fulvia fulva]KAK4623048.1 hypothetical protein CLAFUR0_06831 [Fulvia fulva]UJO18489.1 hypothetical protein CLAFUR5_06964 [Fulvia fulva]WPV16576.1 hypothetical protein CLAFUW4_06828 [Fulvia fulva]WPV30656.1 hypothetical protein CLAFUW7_06827 [Fulvia fulva]
MAKSSRSSRLKKNNAVLKKKVFGPVETARIERQNAKLLELAKQPKERMEVEETTDDSAKTKAADDVDMDEAGKPKKSQREVKRLQDARKQRRERSSHRKPQNQVSFPSHPMKKRSGSKR